MDVTDSGSFAGDGQAGSRSVTVGPDGTGNLTVTTVNDGIDEERQEHLPSASASPCCSELSTAELAPPLYRDMV
ncbi:MAG: hypothetical protein F4226_01270 [Synechococcus sp. SB0678_bin_12]|nr:hypothetical protein [Synechococcus sp. SB0678_bin_12]